MKAVKGYTKDDYRNASNAPVVLEFPSIQAAATYIAEKYDCHIEIAFEGILNDTNADAIYFEDNSVILYQIKE